MKFQTRVYLLYLVALLVAAIVYFTLDGQADVVGHDQNLLYAVELLVVAVPAASLFFSYSWESLAINKKRLAKAQPELRNDVRRQFAYIKIGLFIFSLWTSTLCYVLASYAHNTKYGILVALLHGVLVFPKSSLHQS